MICRLVVLLLIISTLLALLVWKKGTCTLRNTSLEVQNKTVSNPIKRSFPGIDSKTCDEYCSPRIMAELYHSWNEETESLQDPPFSPLLYWKDDKEDKNPIFYLDYSTEPPYDSWICKENSDDWCRTLGWYMAHCHLSNDHPMSSFSLFRIDRIGEMAVVSLNGYRSSCEEFMGPDAVLLEENLPFLQGRVHGTVAVIKNVTRIVFPDPAGHSCWTIHCYLDHNESYQACLQDAQLGVVEVPLEMFVEIKGVICE